VKEGRKRRVESGEKEERKEDSREFTSCGAVATVTYTARSQKIAPRRRLFSLSLPSPPRHGLSTTTCT